LCQRIWAEALRRRESLCPWLAAESLDGRKQLANWNARRHRRRWIRRRVGALWTSHGRVRILRALSQSPPRVRRRKRKVGYAVVARHTRRSRQCAVVVENGLGLSSEVEQPSCLVCVVTLGNRCGRCDTLPVCVRIPPRQRTTTLGSGR